MELIYRLKGNEQLLLDNSENVWILEKGSVAVFATYLQGNYQANSLKPANYRRYLFSVEAGEALFGFSPDIISLLAVAIEPSELSQQNLADLISEDKENSQSNCCLESWIKKLRQTFINTYSGAELDWDSLLFKQQETNELAEKLATFHQYFCRYFHFQQQQEIEAAREQFAARQQLDRQVVGGALAKLATIIQPKAQLEVVSGNQPILVAMGAVGKAMGISISPDAGSEDLNRVKDPVEAIARASQIRTRCVTLESNWWRQENGPLLAYTQTDNHPVALLPIPGNRYILFNPVLGNRIPVNQAVASTLTPQAYTLYRPLPRIVKQALELFRFGTKGYHQDIRNLVIIGIIATSLGMVVPQGTRILIDNAIPDSDKLLLWQLALGMFALAFGQAAFSMSQGIIAVRVESAADATLQPAIWDRLLRLSPSFFRQYSAGDLANRALTVSNIRQKLSSGVQRTLLNGLFALLNLALMFTYSWQLALVGIGITLVAVSVTSISSILIVRKSRLQQEIDGELSGFVVQLINGVAKLRVAMAENRAFAAWAEKYSQRIRLKASFQQINDVVSVFNEALPLISSALLYGFAIAFMQMNQANQALQAMVTPEATSSMNPGSAMGAGTFLAFNSAFGIFLKGVTDLSNTLTDILDVVPMWERANPILHAQPEYTPNKTDPGRLIGRVGLENISFRYEKDGALVLNNINLHANPGEFVAIVGASGSGKSTILRLLLGFETPTKGEVRYDGKDLAELDLQAVRRQLGVVLQNGRINSGSIFDNIAAGALVSLSEVWEAVHMAGLTEDIEQMPMGIHTVISEGGSNISGGQRQRLLIARALVLKPKMIFFDEATSALDNRTQEVVTQSLDKLQATRIVIAHRLSSIRNADRIYVIADGQIIQVGNFTELLQQEGLFARLIARQME